ncbi:hypothetical protein VFPPC_14999 [Pochonia chlamydosporia 170]|uniref:Uncharacterized protein n=1 Tax=Pochonia chlamydosporia 170 TaxID=1380566 RepID=A0A179F2V0_METCM|nr:hypothetical protein VFPPC_14999 [Pochonia chlamydosporia 170]OAQ59757.2 hypothetical protein VFPPC_14999 [Pochonia chlamydosporia 170]
MDIFAVLASYLREELIHNDEFFFSITEFFDSPSETCATDKWVLRRSYIEELYTINEEFEIEVRDHEHVRCTLKLTLQNQDAPRKDTREEIFKTRAWYGPDPDVEVNGQLEALSTSNAKHRADDGQNSTENRILLMVKSYVKGIQILVGKSGQCQRQRLAGLEGCLIQSRIDKEDEITQLIPFFEKLKINGEKVDTICSTTHEHTKDLEQKKASIHRSTASMHNVGCYLTGITKHRNLLPDGQPMPSKGKNRPAFNCGRGVERILGVSSKLAEYYSDDLAISTFTFLEIGACGVTRLGAFAPDKHEKFFCDAAASLIDLSLRRLASSYEEAKQVIVNSTNSEVDQIALCKGGVNHVPVMNPFAFHAWFAEEDYDSLCAKLGHMAFINVPREIFSQLSTSTIIRQACERLANMSKSLTTDTSKSFILHNAPRLAKHITKTQMATRTLHYQDKDGNLKLAVRVLKGDALPQELTTASMAVVYIIIDILLDRCPKPKKGQPPPKLRRASKRQRTLELLPGYADIPTGPQQQPLHWPNSGFQSEADSNSQVQRA